MLKRHKLLSHEAGNGPSQFNPRTCLGILNQPGTYTIAGGTGRYAGISGHGTYQLSLEFIAGLSSGHLIQRPQQP